MGRRRSLDEGEKNNFGSTAHPAGSLFSCLHPWEDPLTAAGCAGTSLPPGSPPRSSGSWAVGAKGGCHRLLHDQEEVRFTIFRGATFTFWTL